LNISPNGDPSGKSGRLIPPPGDLSIFPAFPLVEIFTTEGFTRSTSDEKLAGP
jgi:hypothetical protein